MDLHFNKMIESFQPLASCARYFLQIWLHENDPYDHSFPFFSQVF
jgi:hypothetical protein